MRFLRSLILMPVLLLPAFMAWAQQAAPPAPDLRERRHALIALVADYQDYEDYNPNRSQKEIEAKKGERPSFKVVDADKAAAARLAKAHGFLPRLETIDTTGFPEHEVLNKALLVRELRQEIEGARFRSWRMPVDQLSGIHLWAPRLATLPPHPILQDYEALLAWYRQIPAAFDQTLVEMRKGMAEGLMPPRYLLEKVAGQAEALAKRTPETSPFAEPLAHFPADIPAAKQRKLRADLLKAIRKGILPAYARFAKFVRKEYAPRGRIEPGFWALPDGEAWYAYLVRRSTTLDLTPEQVHQIGLCEVARIETEKAALAKQLGHPDIRSLDAAIAADPRFRAPSPEEFLALYRGHVAAMKAKLPELFLRLPETELEVRAIESYREKEAIHAQYQPGDPGRLMVNTREPRITLSVESTAYHEGFPGHHLQHAVMAANPNLVPFRWGLDYPAYVEGWAHYAEKLGKDVGLYQDPYSEYGRLQDEMLRAIRLVVDTGLHARRWTREQAVQYFREHSSMDPVTVEVEVDRYIVWPTQALGYKIGEMKILELREKARKELGERFDIRKFHERVLSAGFLPLEILEERIETWIAAEKRAAG